MSRRFVYSSKHKKHVESEEPRPAFFKKTKPILPSEKLVSGLMRLRKPGDAGLGDTLERLISKFGGNKFKNIAKRLGINCGCEDRQKYLNKRYPYKTE